MSLYSRGSDVTKKFPLLTFLDLYDKAHARDINTDYNEGLRLLVDYLGPFDIPSVASVTHSRIIGSCDMQELARILGIDYWKLYYICVRRLVGGKN